MMLFRPIYYSQAGTSGTGSGPPAVITINGNTGSAFGPVITLTTGASNAQGTSAFTGNGVTTVTQTFSSTDGLQNTGLGTDSLGAVPTGINNTALGYVSASLLTTGEGNTAIGSASMQIATTAFRNTAIGLNSMDQLTSGSQNVAVGNSTLSSSGFNTGSNNTAVGFQAGSAYAAAESSNILIKNVGTVGDGNTIRIGTQGAGAGQQNRNFQAGIAGVTIPVANRQNVVIDSVTGQLGAGSATQLFPWTDTSGAFLAAINNGYFLTAASTPTLPAAPVQGDEVIFLADTVGTITVTANAGQRIRLGNIQTAIAGTAVNTQQGDSLTLVYRAANATWMSTASIGIWNLT